jgi:hypothetical protein
MLLVLRMDLDVGLRRGLLLLLGAVCDVVVDGLIDLTRNLSDGVLIERNSGILRRGVDVRLVARIVIFDLVDVLQGRGVWVVALLLLRLMDLGWSLGLRGCNRWA